MIIGFIGAGVMARAIGKGLVQGGGFSAKDLICSAPEALDGQPFLDLFPGSHWTPRNDEVVKQSDLTILAVKPQILPEAMSALQEISAGKLFLSIAAGVTLEKICGWLHPTARVVRAMPNTPMQVGEGASVYAGGPNVMEADLALVHRILSAAGKAWPVEEKQIDAITALSGSGPAYVFHFMDALICGAVALGLPEDLARELTLQTVLGSSRLAAQSPLSPLELATQVKSPRGTTLAGCAVLEEDEALNKLMARCLLAAKIARRPWLAGKNRSICSSESGSPDNLRPLRKSEFPRNSVILSGVSSRWRDDGTWKRWLSQRSQPVVRSTRCNFTANAPPIWRLQIVPPKSPTHFFPLLVFFCG